MIKILLVGEVLNHRSFNGANKALPVLASCLHNAGFTQVVQLDLERPDISINDVLHEVTDADLVVFAGCMTPQLPEIDRNTLMVSDRLRQLNRSHVPIIVGGYAAKAVADIVKITPWITAFADGEGEDMIIEIAKSVDEGTFSQDKAQIQGLVFIDDKGKFHQSLATRVSNFNDIDQNFGLVHIPQIHDMNIFKSADGKQLKTAQLFTQKGCPWRCGFCNKSNESSQVFRLSGESFRRQLRQLKQQGYAAVYLDVDTFTVHDKAFRQEAEILHQEGFVWGSNTRIDQIDLEQMLYMVQHNCVYMFFGVEHTMPEVMLAVGKFNGSLQSQMKQALAYPQQVEKVFQEMAKAGLPSSYFVILGLPKAKLGESSYEPTTFEDDMTTIRFGVEKCDPDFLNFNMLRFMPGSVAADVPNHPAYSCVRPSGGQPITASYFLPRATEYFGYQESENHGVYRLCESVGRNQPTTTAMNAVRVYETIHDTMQLINAKINAGGKATKLFLDRDLLVRSLVKQDELGRYTLAPLGEFEKV